MKISQIDVRSMETGVELELLDINGEQFPEDERAYIKVRSVYSEHAQKVRAEQAIKVAEDVKNGIEIDEVAENVEILLSLVIGWRGFEDEDGNEIKYSEELMKEYLTNHILIRNQVNNFVMNKNNFLGSIAKT